MRATSQTFKFLQASVFCILFGTGLAHIFGPQPYNITYGDPQGYQVIVGTIFLMMSMICLLPIQKTYRHKLHFLYAIASLLLLFHSFNSLINSGYVPEQMVEHSLKIGLPIVLLLTIEFRNKTEFDVQLLRWLKILIAAAFIGHAMFALGLHYIPENFYNMTMTILPLSRDEATLFLMVVGILDILCAVMLFTPFNRFFVYYLIVWGVVTAIARTWYGLLVTDHLTGSQFLDFAGNTIFRLPHGIIPLLILILENRKSRKIND
ncbi:MAG: hypothetical protein ACO2Z9_03375 [Crocinitomicaceae bacterium]